MRLFLLGALAAVGCGTASGPAFPELAPVKGVVKRGAAPVAGGVVKFTPDPDTAEFLVNAEVGTDGAFTLSTVRTTDKTGERKPGAAAGKYAVTYFPPAGDQTTGGVPTPVNLPPMTVPKEGHAALTLELPKK